MKATVKLKYSVGDIVTVDISNIKYNSHNYGDWFRHLSIPKDKEYAIDGYRIIFENDCEPLIQYVFHCYCDDYIGYHDLIPEEYLNIVGESHPQEVNVDFNDVFDDDINIGDMIYCRLYNKQTKDSKIAVTPTVSFVSGGNVKELYYCYNL